jgi:hypothetical protein
VTLLELERLIPDAVLDDFLPSPIPTRNETIITHACRNPGNAIAGARLGALLALVRLRLPREVEFALRAARADLPETAQYRLPARIRRPKITQGGIAIGGDDPAGVYRDEMRSTWQKTPGALDWLREHW